MNTRRIKCTDPILETLGLGNFYHGNKPLTWLADSKPSFLHEKTAQYKATTKTNKLDTQSDEQDLSKYFVDTKKEGPYASLLTDLTFKKAFSPDTEQGKINLINLLNDILKGQITHRITDVTTRMSEYNDSGSKESKTSIFDLHCCNERGEFIEIEVQIREKKNFLKRLVFYSSQMIIQQGHPGRKWNYRLKPTYVIAITKHKVFKKDDLPIHRAGIWNYTSGKNLVDCMNFTIVELPKITKIIRENDSEAAKWMFALRYLNRLKRLPPALNDGKFKGLLETAKVAKFNKEELERYRRAMYTEWDRYEDEAYERKQRKKFIKKIEQDVKNSIKQKLQKNNVSQDIIEKCLTSLSGKISRLCKEELKRDCNLF